MLNNLCAIHYVIEVLLLLIILFFLRNSRLLKSLLTKDFKTGILNEKGLESAYQQVQKAEPHNGGKVSFTRRSDSCHLLYIDVDNFKQVNEILTHRRADDVLVSITRILEDSVRKSDSVARVGGDEFVVLLIGVTDSRASEIGNEICVSVASLSMEFCTPIGVSIGLSKRSTGESLSDILMRVDKDGMYAAKAQGKGQLTVIT